MKETGMAPYRIRVFPNSGHQYFDIPLKDLLPGKDAPFLEKLTLGNNDTSWQHWSEYVPWVLYRFKMQDAEPTVSLCVETNLGTRNRGLLFEVEEDLQQDCPDADDITSPYASSDEAQLEADYKDRLLPLTSLPNKEGRDLPINLEIYWVKRGGYDPVDVDLIVDLGNTRTVALLLEMPGPELSSRQLRRRVQILRFTPRGAPVSYGIRSGSILMDDCAIIDSWMLLHRTQFHDLEPPQTLDKLSTTYEPVHDANGKLEGYRVKRYLPHTFVELSPAIIGGGRSSVGGARHIYAMCQLNTDARFYLGSPKRYVWDDQQQGEHGGTFWRQIPNDTDKNIPPDYYGLLSGLFRYFMDPSGLDWDIDNPPTEDDFRGLPFPNSEPSYPRRDAVCWFALAVLEAAHRQINSPHYLSVVGRETLPRRLHNIRITYPAGWTYEERSRFFEQWQRAINLFTMTRFSNHEPVSFGTDRVGGSRPVLAEAPMDEAVCSQLPIIYSDVKTLMGNGTSWLDLYGDGESVTVMNVDIGGGTTDMAIIRYSMANTSARKSSLANIQTKLLFRDGCSIAGDVLVKRIIEQVLLPAWMDASGKAQYEGIPDARTWVASFFQKPTHAEFSQVDSKASIKLARIVRLVFVPLVNQWLSQLVSAGDNPESGWEKLDIGEAISSNLINNQALIELNQLLNKVIRMKARNGRAWEGTVFSSEPGIYIQSDRETIESSIDEVFGGLFDHLAKLAGRFDCQLAIISGKPSEQPRIMERIRNCFPLLSQRIIHMKNFPAGDWYPFSSFTDGRIMDAKTCTVVGAALYQDICNGNLPEMTVQRETDNLPQRNYYWSILQTSGYNSDTENGYLFSPSDYPSAQGERIASAPKRFEISLPCRIGRQIMPVPGVIPDPVYEIRHSPMVFPPIVGLRVFVTLRWVSVRGEGERLELLKVEHHPDFTNIDTNDVSMRLNTMLEENHWLDEPHFEMKIS